jgi:hypothetical protein
MTLLRARFTGICCVINLAAYYSYGVQASSLPLPATHDLSRVIVLFL